MEWVLSVPNAHRVDLRARDSSIETAGGEPPRRPDVWV